MILVTGATGNLGAKVIEKLLQKTANDNIVALARKESNTDWLKSQGISIRYADYDDAAALEKVFERIDKLLLISGDNAQKRLQQHINVVDAAKKSGVKYLAFTSIAVKDLETSNIKAMLEPLVKSEDYVKQSGIPYTIFSNSFYADFLPVFTGNKEAVLANGISFPAGLGVAPYALREEMGEAIANVLLQDNHENKTYLLGNSELYSFNDIAKAFTEISGKMVIYNDVTPKAFLEKATEAGVPQGLTMVNLGMAGELRDGQADLRTTDLENLLGRKPASLTEMLKVVYSV